MRRATRGLIKGGHGLRLDRPFAEIPVKPGPVGPFVETPPGFWDAGVHTQDLNTGETRYTPYDFDRLAEIADALSRNSFPGLPRLGTEPEG